MKILAFKFGAAIILAVVVLATSAQVGRLEDAIAAF